MEPTKRVHHTECGCGVPQESGERRAIGVDPEIKDRNLKRLRRARIA